MRKILIPLFLTFSFFLTACGDQEQSPTEVAQQFWQAAQEGKMDAAKQMVSWNTTGYLKYFKDEKFKIKRIDLAEAEVKGQKGEVGEVVSIDTTLVLAKKDGSDVRIPTKTVLIQTEGVWRVQLKQTMAAVLERTMNAVANQFNQMLREGMQELNKALTGSVDEISKSLEEGAKELGETLEDNAKEFGDSINKFQQELEKNSPKFKEKHPSRKEI